MVLTKSVPKACIVDYGMGNLKSVANAIKHVGGCDVVIGAKKEDLRQADFLILPGVGAYSDAVEHLHSRDLFDELNELVLEEKKNLLAICLGMQLIVDRSEEGGGAQGFGWIPGDVTKFTCSEKYRIPHMGWDNISVKGRQELFHGVDPDPDFYFVHSYHVNCANEYVIATCDYGYEFNAAIAKDNIIGFQFHPERSHKNGLRLLSNYIDDIKGKV